MTRKVFYIIFGVALAFALVAVAPSARADQLDLATQLTFHQPVEVPGNVVLPAGTYWFTLLGNPVTDPGVVQIFNADRTRILATVDTIAAVRPELNGHTQLTFAEQSANQPIALISWFYPGRATGYEFVYPSSQEAKLSENEQITVMAQPGSLVQAS